MLGKGSRVGIDIGRRAPRIGGRRAAAVEPMKTLPTNAEVYKETPIFTEATAPAGLRARHTTKAGTWGRIVIFEGALRYRILEPVVEEHLLTPEHPGVVEPEVPHEVEPMGAVRFRVQFLRERT
jgi:tellurite resistance-related uncharacterized protein